MTEKEIEMLPLLFWGITMLGMFIAFLRCCEDISNLNKRIDDLVHELWEIKNDKHNNKRTG